MNEPPTLQVSEPLSLKAELALDTAILATNNLIHRRQIMNTFIRYNLFPKPKLRDNVFHRDGFRCRKCGSGTKLTLHHVKPRRDGGRNKLENLLTLCETCHTNWHKLEVRFPWLEFPCWQHGGGKFQRSLERAKLLRRVLELRWTGSSLEETAASLNERSLLSPRGRDWTAPNLGQWLKRNFPDIGQKREFLSMGGANFCERITDDLYRWWRLLTPIALIRKTSSAWNCFRYDFVTSKRKQIFGFKEHARFINGVVALSESRDVFKFGTFHLQERLFHQRRVPKRVLIQCGTKVRVADKAKFGSFVFRGPAFTLPRGLHFSHEPTWLSWQKTEAILMELHKENALPRLKSRAL